MIFFTFVMPGAVDGPSPGIHSSPREFTQKMIPAGVPAAKFPALAAHSAACERLAEFRAAPHGDGTYRAA
jgi:hypothetical protein